MKTTRIAAVGLISVSLAVGGLVGCGSSSSDSAAADTAAADTAAADAGSSASTDAEFIAAVNQVCADGRAAIQAAQADGDVTTLEGAQATVAASADAASAMADELKAITPPADGEAGLAAYIEANDAVVASGQALLEKVNAATDLTEAQQAVAESANAEAELTAKSVAAAKAAGFTECASSGDSGSSDSSNG